jgi:hypothetical protein
MSQCEVCGQTAHVHIVNIQNGVETYTGLCEEHAKAQGIDVPQPPGPITVNGTVYASPEEFVKAMNRRSERPS